MGCSEMDIHEGHHGGSVVCSRILPSGISPLKITGMTAQFTSNFTHMINVSPRETKNQSLNKKHTKQSPDKMPKNAATLQGKYFATTAFYSVPRSFSSIILINIQHAM